MSAPRVAAIVVNWNRAEDTLRCLASLRASTGVDLSIVVVDNASSDGSCAAITLAYPDVEIIRNERNLGFAEGNNVAIRRLVSRGVPYLLLLNNDALVAPDAIRQLVEPLEEDPKLGVTSGAVCYLSQPHVVWSAGGRIDRRTGEVGSDWHGAGVGDLPSEPWWVDHVTGCCMLVRGAAIRRAGALDRRFFMYFEETEWCARIARAGYGLLVVPSARIWHAIDPRAQEGSPAIAYYMTRNHLLYLRATHAPASAWAITLFRQGRTIASLFARPGSVTKMRGRVPMLRAMRDFALGRFGPAKVAR
jgi:hypothetical protein